MTAELRQIPGVNEALENEMYKHNRLIAATAGQITMIALLIMSMLSVAFARPGFTDMDFARFLVFILVAEFLVRDVSYLYFNRNEEGGRS